MQLKNQVCTLEQAKRLNELGVFETSTYWYNQHSYTDEGNICDGDWSLSGKRTSDSTLRAYNTAELGVMLPLGFCSGNGTHSIATKWCDQVTPDGLTFIGDCKTESTEAKARAAMLIYLLENKLITPEQVNTSLTQQQ